MGMRRFLVLACLVGFEAGAILALHRLGSLAWLRVDWRHLARWAGSSPLEDVIPATIRVVALACAYWLLGSTLLYAQASATRIPGALRAAEWIALPAVRRVVERALALTLVASAA